MPLGIEPRGDGGAEVPLPGVEAVSKRPRSVVEAVSKKPRSVVEAVMMPALVLLGVEPTEASWTAVEGPGFAGFEPTLSHLSLGVEPSFEDDPGAAL